MIEYSPIAWLGFVSLVALASWTGTQVSKVLHWKESACRVGLPLAFGCGIAPFLAGFAIMAPTAVLYGASHGSQLAVAAVLLLASGLGAKAFQKPQAARFNASNTGAGVFLLGVLLWAWLLMLGINTVFLPLLQNDALEYATVGRILFESRNLFSYPAINPEAASSGFYGPWTHPPLYIALIYLSYIIQGHADEPGLMRLIAPWFLVTAVYALITLGRLVSRQTGLLCGILLISTPLLFLGADSALIDALPVSGMVLLLLVLVGLQENQPRYSLSVGAVLGVVLWTHSQAILFIALVAAVLFFREGLLRWRVGVVSVATATTVALLIGGGYYVRNYFLFGSPISDNPVVFALKTLDWESYFSYARGLDHTAAKLQYGLFKGWFSFEAYGLLFWLGAAGFAVMLAKMPSGFTKKIVLAGTRSEETAVQLYLVCLAIFVVYFLGVVLSMAVGIDLMIRNERYLLAMVPIFCVGGALAISSTWTWLLQLSHKSNASIIQKTLVYLYFLAISTFLICCFLVFGFYYRWRHPVDIHKRGIAFNSFTLPGRAGWFNYYLNLWPHVNSVRAASSLTPSDARILSLRPADMYYSERKMVSYLDPSLVPFYESKDSASALAALKKLGIRYIDMPDYFLPPVYNSQLMNIVADPSLSKLIYSNGAAQLYELEDSRLKRAGVVEVGPNAVPWIRATQLRLGGRKAAAALGFPAQSLKDAASTSEVPLFHRDYSVLLSNGQSNGPDWRPSATFIGVERGEYLLSVELEGEGYIIFWLQEFDAAGRPVERASIDGNEPIRIGDVSLPREQAEFTLKRRMVFADQTKYIRIGIEHVGKSHVRIDRISLEKLVPHLVESPLASESES